MFQELKDHGQSPLQVALKAGKYDIADYVTWANRGHFPEPYPGPRNRSLYLDDFISEDESDMDETKELRSFMQEYFRSRKLSPSLNGTQKCELN